MKLPLSHLTQADSVGVQEAVDRVLDEELEREVEILADRPQAGVLREMAAAARRWAERMELGLAELHSAPLEHEDLLDEPVVVERRPLALPPPPERNGRSNGAGRGG